jgi:hypothetical protein
MFSGVISVLPVGNISEATCLISRIEVGKKEGEGNASPF